VSQHFIDWYTFSHIGHGIAVYVFMLAFAGRSGADFIAFYRIWGLDKRGYRRCLGSDRKCAIRRQRSPLHSCGFGNAAGDSVVNTMGDMLATISGFLIAARVPTWLSVVIIATILFVLPGAVSNPTVDDHVTP
jgi:Protein of unknown function (DUF2585)